MQNKKVYLDRPYYSWRIRLNWPDSSEIVFGAVGFTQTLRAEPVLTEKQCLRSARGAAYQADEAAGRLRRRELIGESLGASSPQPRQKGTSCAPFCSLSQGSCSWLRFSCWQSSSRQTIPMPPAGHHRLRRALVHHRWRQHVGRGRESWLSVAEELPIFLIFGVPAAVAILLKWRLL